jgi:hypothetical protein
MFSPLGNRLLCLAAFATASTAPLCQAGYTINFSGASPGLTLATDGPATDLRIVYSVEFLATDLPDPNGIVEKTVNVSVTFDPDTDPKFPVPILALAPSAAANVHNNLNRVVGDSLYAMDLFYFQVIDEGFDRTLFRDVNAAGPPSPFTGIRVAQQDGEDFRPISYAEVIYSEPRPGLLGPGRSFRTDAFQFTPTFDSSNPANFRIRVGARYQLVPEPGSLLLTASALALIGSGYRLARRRPRHA